MDCEKSDAVWKAARSSSLSDRRVKEKIKIKIIKKQQLLKSKMTQQQQRAHTCYINNVKNTYAGNNMKAAEGRLMSRNVISSVPNPN